ncbi:matrixin family metalloprotease [Halocatena marina]|uniref:Matrixin family metalloprotease n=1 Tax=Halocatena marina TaxID=2934937 RepID=A0ABD5YQA1_9EURY|nr:matrixin family metalloprotease [Halocatena marina]
MTTRVLPVLVLVMVVLAGCSGMLTGSNTTNATNSTSTLTPDGMTNPNAQPTIPGETGPDENPPTSAASPASTQTSASSSASSSPTDDDPSSHDGATPDPGSDAVPSKENPWGERTLTVAIKDETGNDRAFEPLVQNALAYWEQNSRKYAGYQINYRLEPDAANPDVVVSFVPSIEECGVEEQVEGCAPYIRSPEEVNRPANVQVRSGYTDESTVKLLIHEFGHTLGLGHDDKPKKIMAATTDLTTLPKPNVTERALPWDHSTLSVAVDLSGVPATDRATVNSQVDKAFAYYDQGADGTVPNRVSFRRVSNPEEADIVVQFTDDSPCQGLKSGSCSVASGYDPDDDGATETYAKTRIVITNVEPKTVAWHVGNRLGEDAFGFDHPSDFPQPLRGNAPTETRRSNWWA